MKTERRIAKPDQSVTWLGREDSNFRMAEAATARWSARCGFRVVAMPRDGAIIFCDVVGKVTVLRIKCEKCRRSSQYRLDRLITRCGIDAKRRRRLPHSSAGIRAGQNMERLDLGSSRMIELNFVDDVNIIRSSGRPAARASTPMTAVGFCESKARHRLSHSSIENGNQCDCRRARDWEGDVNETVVVG